MLGKIKNEDMYL